MTPAPAPADGPGLGSTTSSIASYLRWCQAELDGGRCEPRLAETRAKLADCAMKNVRLEAGLHELAELREIVKRAELAADRRKKNETDDRYGQLDAQPEFGRVPLTQEQMAAMKVKP